MKQVWGVTMVKDSEDIIYHTLIHMAEEGLDGIIVANNMSTDNTLKEIKKAQSVLKDSPCKIIIVQDNEVGYYQSRKMTALARLASEQGADWVIPFDDDELWFAGDTIKNFLNSLPDHINVVNADLFDHYGSALDEQGAIPFQNICWRKAERLGLPKVAFRWHNDAIIGQGNHSVSIPKAKATTGLQVRHFPYRSWEQFKRKALNGLKAYQATDLPESFGGHWRSYGNLILAHGDEQVRKEVYERWFWFFSPVDNGMIYDPAPFRRWNK